MKKSNKQHSARVRQTDIVFESGQNKMPVVFHIQKMIYYTTFKGTFLEMIYDLKDYISNNIYSLKINNYQK